LLYEKNIVAKSKEVKTGCNLAEYSKEGYGSKRSVLPMMKMMMMMMMMVMVMMMTTTTTTTTNMVVVVVIIMMMIMIIHRNILYVTFVICS
jgi:hypothetical protein